MYKKYSIALCIVFMPCLVFSMGSPSYSSSSPTKRSWSPSTSESNSPEPSSPEKKKWTPSTPPPAPAACTLYATPKDDIIATIVTDINAVEPQGYVGIESPSLTNTLIIQSLGQALLRGVKVRIFTDTQSAITFRENFKRNAQVFGRNDLHAKRIVIAKKIPVTKDDEAIVYLGSLNMSNNGIYNHEIMMRCTNRSIFTESYGDQWRELSSRAVKPIEIGTKRIVSSKSTEARNAKKELVTTFNTCTHPHDHLYIATYTLDNPETIAALIQTKNNSPMPITIILDGENWRNTRLKTKLKELVDAELDVYIFNKDGTKTTPFNFTTLTHAKAILRNCNQTCAAMISTANFTTQGITDINYDFWEPCSLTFFYRLKGILDDIIDQSEKLEPYMFEVHLPTNPDQDGKKLLEELWQYLIQKNKIPHKTRIMNLIANGANLELRDKDGITALMKATSSGDQEIVQALLNAGADANQRTSDYETALAIATRSGFTEIAHDLIAAHADLNVGDRYGNTALFYAIDRKNIPLIKILLDAGANPNIPGDYRTVGQGRFSRTGSVPLLIRAIQDGNQEIIQMLLEKGARPQDKDRDGKNAFDAAKNKPQILEMLNRAMLQRK